MEGNRTNENNNEVRDINILLFSERSHEKVFFVNTLVNCSANRSPREAKRKRPLVYMVPCESNVTDKHDGNHKITIKSNVDDYHKIHRLKIWTSNEKCHDMCFLSNMPEEFVGWSEHKFCKCISEATDTCSVCHRPRSDHMHRYYLTYKLNESRILRNVTEYLTDIPEKLGAVFEGFRAIMKERQDSLEEDKETLSKCVTKFVRFLEKHSDNPFNDVYKNYMNLMISRESQLEKNADPLIIQEWKKVLSEYLALHDVYLSFHKDGSFLQDEISKLSRSNNFGNILIQMYRCQTVPRTNEFIATHSGHTYFDLKRVDTGIKDMTNRELNDNNKENLESWKLAEQIGSYNIISSHDAQGSILENSVDTVSDIRNTLEATTLSDSNTDLSSVDSYSQNNDATSLDVYSQQSGGRDPRNPRNRSSCDNPSTPGRNSSIFAQSTLQHNKCTSNPSALNTTSYLNKRFLTEYRHSNDNRLYNNGQTFPSSLPNSSLDSDYSTHDNQSSDHSNSVDIYSLPVFNIHSLSNYSYTTKPPSNYAQEPLNQEENMFASDIQSNNIQNPLYQQEKFGGNAQQMFSYDDTLTGYPSPHSSSRDRRRPNMEHIVFHQSHPAGENIQQSSSNRTEIFMPMHSTSPHMTQVARNELQPGPHPYDHPILIGGHHPLPFKYMEQEGLHHQPSPTGKNVQERSSNPRQYLQPVPDTQGNRPPSVVRVTNQKSRRVRKKVHKTSSTAQISDTKSNESKYQKNKKAMKGTTFDNTQSLVTKQNSLSTNVDQNTQTEYFYPKKVSDPKFYEGTPIFMQESNSRIPPQNIQSSDNRSRSLSLVEPLYIDIQEDSFLLDAEYQNIPNALMPVVHNIHQINKKLPVKL